jgi:hypothetical protein
MFSEHRMRNFFEPIFPVCTSCDNFRNLYTVDSDCRILSKYQLIDYYSHDQQNAQLKRFSYY